MKHGFLKFSVGLGVVVAVFSAAFTPVQAAETKNLTVIELFTSEGCNSCPPADKYANELAKRPNLLELSWFVEYWNYLGWTDTFGQRAYSERQRAYNQKLGLAGVYTPQMIINGAVQEVGSHREKIEARIAEAAKHPARRAPLTLTNAQGKILIDLGPFDIKSQATVRLIGFKSSADVAIHGGELKGLTMHYSNIVTYSHKLGIWDGKQQHYSQAAADLIAAGADHYAVLVQDGDVGPVIAAGKASLSLPVAAK